MNDPTQDPQFEARWATAPKFAEVAEALSIPTDHVMAMTAREQGRAYVVVYSPTLSEPLGDSPLATALLRRDADGILVPFGEPQEVPGGWRQVHEEIEARLRERFGEPRS